DNGDDTFTALFGLDSGCAQTITIPLGTDNRFSPSPTNRGQPTSFAPGRTPFPAGDLRVTWSGSSLAWTLTGKTATATHGSPRCVFAAPARGCPKWVLVNIELPAGYDPGTISVASVRLSGSVAPDPSYQKLVDGDQDGVAELQVRFSLDKLRPLLVVGVN